MNIAKLMRGLAAVRKIDRDLPVPHLMALLFIAENPGCSINELLDYLTVTSSTGTRITTRLGPGSIKRSGLNLINVEIDEHDRRLRTLTTTRRGTELVESMNRIMGG